MVVVPHSISLLATPSAPCEYIEGETAVTHFIGPQTDMSPVLYGVLMEKGFRRSGRLVYQHACPNCQKCQSLKIDPQRFKASRSQRRCLKKNEDLSMVLRKAEFQEEYFDLYFRYINSRHGDGGMVDPMPESFSDFLMSEWSSTWFVEMRLDGRLLGVAVIDRVPKGLSAVYTFYDPDEIQRGLGTFAVLWQLQLARSRNIPWVYLGYWIKGSEKMDYKSRFGPAHVLRGDRWEPLELA